MGHSVKLKPEYVKKLQGLSLPKIAREAAMHRGRGQSCGAVTALILDWVVKVEIPARRPDGGAAQAVKFFFKQYYKAWDAEQQWRSVHGNVRELERPIVGERRPVSWKKRGEVLDLDWDRTPFLSHTPTTVYA